MKRNEVNFPAGCDVDDLIFGEDAGHVSEK